jgi:lysozyme
VLKSEVEEYCDAVNKCVKVPLNQYQFDALVSWTYNLGESNLKNSTLLKVLNDGDYEGVPFQIKRWNKANGKVLSGLTRRRKAEAELFRS